MKTTVEYVNGTVEVFDGEIPTINPDDDTLGFMDAACNVTQEDVPLAEVVKVVFEP